MSEQRLGILGGMGHQATQDFYQRILDRTDASCDQEHLPTLIWSDTSMPARTAAILGGIGNIPGAMIGGLLLGVIEALAAGYIAIAWKDAIAFTVLILILIIRPTGILGERTADKL